MTASWRGALAELAEAAQEMCREDYDRPAGFTCGAFRAAPEL